MRSRSPICRGFEMGSALPLPQTPGDLCDAIADAARENRPLEARAGGTKEEIGRPDRNATILPLSAFTGIVDYEPNELVLTVRPATPLAEVEILLQAHGQMLAFEPWDHGPLFGRTGGAATIGGIVAAGVSGPRRVSAGAPRDHLLGFEAVSGRGEIFRAGGKVVKNVTGYDVSKVIAGSWGQLAIMTELTLKVVPSPRAATTFVIDGLGVTGAIAAMARAMGSSCALAAAAYLPATAGSTSRTALRLEGFRESVDARGRQLCEHLAGLGHAVAVAESDAEEFWRIVRQGETFAGSDVLWRAHLAPSRVAGFADAVDRAGGRYLLDWAGALAWVSAPPDWDARGAMTSCGGHAMLLRGSRALRAKVRARQSDSLAVAALSARLKQAFDPAGILDPLRFA